MKATGSLKLASLAALLLAILLLIATGDAALPQKRRVLTTKKLPWYPKPVQERFLSRTRTKQERAVAKSEDWPFPTRTVFSGSLIADTKAKRAVYEAETAPLYVLTTSDTNSTKAVECIQGTGWLYVANDTPYMKECLPWWLLRLELRRLSMDQGAPGAAMCSFLERQSQYPQCQTGAHCDVSQGRCVLTKKLKLAQDSLCPANSGLIWSKDKNRCVQCLVSKHVLPSITSNIASSDYYRSSYVCDSNGNAFPPLAVSINSQLYTDPRASFYLAIFICLLLSIAIYLVLWKSNVKN